MSLPPHVNVHLSSSRGRVNLQWLTVVALLIPGCGGQRIDLLTSRYEKEAPEAADANLESQPAKDELEASSEEQSLIAEQEDEGPLSRLTAFARRGDQDQPEDRSGDGFARRIRGIWGGDDSTEQVVTTDPFVGYDEKSTESQPTGEGQLVKSDASSFDELMASLRRNKPEPPADPAHAKPWWQGDGSAESLTHAVDPDAPTQFADDFDSRLEQLRAELASTPELAAPEENLNVDTDFSDVLDESKLTADPQTRIAEDDGFNPFAQSRERKIAMSAGGAFPEIESASDCYDAKGTPQTDLFAMPRTESQNPAADPGQATAANRVQELMIAAQRAWDNGEVAQAYRQALDAQALAVLENLEFAPGERRPQDLAERIESALRPESTSEAAGDDVPKMAGIPQETHDSSLSPFEFPEFGPVAGGWDSSGDDATIAADDHHTKLTESTDGSGVSLMPPDDDFPSEAERRDWSKDSNFHAKRPTEVGQQASDEIQLTIHEGADGSLRSPQTSGDRSPGFTDDHNQELLSNVSKQKSRVFKMNKMEWPSLPSVSEADSDSEPDEGPIRVAQAPLFAPDVEAAAASTPATSTEAPASESQSLLGQIWRSQPIWLVGGLVLLVIALRLLPWPRDDNAG